MNDWLFSNKNGGGSGIVLCKCTLVGRLFKKASICGTAGGIKWTLMVKNLEPLMLPNLLPKVGLLPDIQLAHSPPPRSPVMDKLTFLQVAKR